MFRVGLEPKVAIEGKISYFISDYNTIFTYNWSSRERGFAESHSNNLKLPRSQVYNLMGEGGVQIISLIIIAMISSAF